MRAEDKGSELACVCMLREKSGNWMRGAEDKGYGLVCACATPKTKSTDWYVLARR